MTISQTGYSRDLAGSYITKDPDSVLDYSIDWSDWLPTGDTITSATMTQESTHTANLTVGSATILDGVVSSQISGGAVGNVYVIKNTIVTNEGLTDVRRFKIRVEKRYV